MHPYHRGYLKLLLASVLAVFAGLIARAWLRAVDMPTWVVFLGIGSTVSVVYVIALLVMGLGRIERQVLAHLRARYDSVWSGGN
jgi:Na+-driven multidrug efflux pump